MIDLVVPGDGKGRLYYYEAVEPQAAAYRSIEHHCIRIFSVCRAKLIVDLDDDGDLDIVAAIFDTSVAKPYQFLTPVLLSRIPIPQVRSFLLKQTPDL